MKFSFVVFLLLLPLTKTRAQAGKFHAGASYVYQHMHYKEPGVMSEKGKLQGVGLDARYDFTDELRTSLQAKILSGELEYDGATFSGTPIKQTTKDKLREYRALVSYRVTDITTYAGYGTRYWSNDLVISYLRETTYKYVPLGLTYTWAPFYINYERKVFLNGLNKSHMSDTGGGRKDVEMKQKSGKGYSFETGFFQNVGSFDVKVSVGYEYWQIENSETANDGVDTLIEPHNRTGSWIVSVGFFF